MNDIVTPENTQQVDTQPRMEVPRANARAQTLHEVIAIAYLPKIAAEPESPQVTGFGFMQALKEADTPEKKEALTTSLKAFWLVRAQAILSDARSGELIERELGDNIAAYTQAVIKRIADENIDQISPEAAIIKQVLLAEFLQQKTQVVDETDIKVFQIVVGEYKLKKGYVKGSEVEFKLVNEELDRNNSEILLSILEIAFYRARDLKLADKSSSESLYFAVEEIQKKLKRARDLNENPDQKRSEAEKKFAIDRGREMAKKHETATYYELVIDAANYAELIKIQDYLLLSEDAFSIKKSQAVIKLDAAKKEVEEWEKTQPIPIKGRYRNKNKAPSDIKERYERAQDELRIFERAEEYINDENGREAGREKLIKEVGKAKTELGATAGNLQKKLLKDLAIGLEENTPENGWRIKQFIEYVTDFTEDGFIQKEYPEIWRLPSKAERLKKGLGAEFKKKKKQLGGLLWLLLKILGVQSLTETQTIMSDLEKAA